MVLTMSAQEAISNTTQADVQQRALLGDLDVQAQQRKIHGNLIPVLCWPVL